MNTKIRYTLLALALLALPMVALADSQLNGVGAVYWGVVQTFGATDATCVLDPGIDTTPDDPNDNARVSGCALFPASASNRLHAAVATVFIPVTTGFCFWSGDDTLELDAAGAYVSGYANAETTNPIGAPISMSAPGAPHHQKASREAMRDKAAAGMRTGLCPNPVSSGGDILYAPCFGGTDTVPPVPPDTCPAAHGGGTCVRHPSSTQRSQAGMMALCEGGDVHVRKEVIPGWSN